MAKKNEHFLRELSFVIYVRKKWSSKHENVKSREEMILKYVMKKKEAEKFWSNDVQLCAIKNANMGF